MKQIKLIGLALGASLALSTAALAQDITVAVAGPMTGGESAFGRQMKNGAEQAIADINAAGGVLGKKLALFVGDDACDPKQARSVAEKIAGSKIPFVAGHYCSSSSIPASEAYADGNVLQITPASTNPLFTERKLWNVARVCGRDDQQGLVAADYIAKNYKGKNVAILNDKTTYGKGLADETKKALNKAGFTEKMFESYNKGDKDFTAIVSRMKRDNIDLVYVGGYHQESGLIVRQMRDQGLKTVLMAGDALADKEFASITGPAGEGTLFTFGPDPRNKPTAKAIVEKLQGQGHRSGRLHALHLRRDAGVDAGRRQGRHHRSEEGDGYHQGRRLGHRDRQDGVRRQGRHQADRLRRLQMGRQGQLRRDRSRQGNVRQHACAVIRGRASWREPRNPEQCVGARDFPGLRPRGAHPGMTKARDPSRAASTIKTIDQNLMGGLMFVHRQIRASLFAALTLIVASHALADSAVQTDPDGSGIVACGARPHRRLYQE